MSIWDNLNRINPARWIREGLSGEDESARDFWLGQQYKPPEDLRLRDSDRHRQRLGALARGLSAPDPWQEAQRQLLGSLRTAESGYGEEIDRLRGLASGTEAGAGEVAARRAGERQLASLRSQANSARGFGAATQRANAMNLSAELGTQLAGEAGMAGLQDRANAEQQLLATLRAQSSDQVARQNLISQLIASGRNSDLERQRTRLDAYGRMADIDRTELDARVRLESLRQAAAAGDQGAVQSLLTMLGSIAPVL